MEILDILILTVLLISGLFAFLRGFVQELLSIAAWAGAVLATVYGVEYLAPLARDMTGRESLADIGAALFLFIVVLVVLSIVNRLVARRVQRSSLSTLDRSLGLVFGLLRGGLLICLAWIMVVWAVPRRDFPEWVTEARILPLVEQTSSHLYALVPEELQPQDEPDLDEDAFELQPSFEQLLRPKPKSDVPEQPTGYKNTERKELDRLIEASQ